MIIISVIPLCTQQCGLGGLDDSLKDNFYDKLIRAVRKLRGKLLPHQAAFMVMLEAMQKTLKNSTQVMVMELGLKKGGFWGFVQLLIQQKSPSHLMRLVYHELR